MTKKVLILGVNGFIGSWLTHHILHHTRWEVYGMDMANNKVLPYLTNPRFHFTEGDITITKEWIQYHVKKCDVILPLVAIANPALYVSQPLNVFKLDFEANLHIVKECVKHNKRLIFPSTSEVYGMSKDKEFDEETSNLVLGPIHKQRWIYSCSKQMLDRVIYAYGIHNNLDYTLFRPFNWLGPRMDDVYSSTEGQSRAIIQFISNVLYGRPIKLVNGGNQRRCFTSVEEGVDALAKMIENKNGEATQRIFNIGNPRNDFSMAEAAEMIIEAFADYPVYADKAKAAQIIHIEGSEHFGKHYEDLSNRVPKIENAKKYLKWEPKMSFKTILKKTLDYHLIDHPEELRSTVIL